MGASGSCRMPRSSALAVVPIDLGRGGLMEGAGQRPRDPRLGVAVRPGLPVMSSLLSRLLVRRSRPTRASRCPSVKQNPIGPVGGFLTRLLAGHLPGLARRFKPAPSFADGLGMTQQECPVAGDASSACDGHVVHRGPGHDPSEREWWTLLVLSAVVVIGAAVLDVHLLSHGSTVPSTPSTAHTAVVSGPAGGPSGIEGH
jgi:hypothetical protein